jgi:hypothetical protein
MTPGGDPAFLNFWFFLFKQKERKASNRRFAKSLPVFAEELKI